MIVDQRQIDYFKKIASQLYIPVLISDYGAERRDQIIFLTDNITNIYKHLRYTTFNSVTIYVSLTNDAFISTLAAGNYNTVRSQENLSQVDGADITLEVKENGEIHYSLQALNPLDLITNAIVYKFTRSTETEVFFGLTSEIKLPPIPDADSYFSIQTYKELEVALEDYATKIARHSECRDLKDVWFDKNRIFFKSKPEHILRDSLTAFLKLRLRNTEVRPEQIVDKSHPVDIKVTWSLASHLALIEIKWLGKSLSQIGRSFKQIYTRVRALDGANQLANYLDANMRQAPVKTTKGYLVVFDGRRWGTNPRTTTISAADGMRYANEIIAFSPDHHTTRKDFAKPVVFFLEPITA